MGEDTLEKSLNRAGFSLDDITDNFLTHLHFDHCGGGVRYRNGDPAHVEMTFKNAKYWSNEAHWQWATQPNAREKASFLKENILPMQESGHLAMVDLQNKQFTEHISVITVDGHTDKQMLPKFQYKGHTIVYAADLLPSVGHIPIPYVMGYDTRPLLTLEEKQRFLEEAADQQYVLFLEHDGENECCTVTRTEKGIRLDRTFSLSEL